MASKHDGVAEILLNTDVSLLIGAELADADELRTSGLNRVLSGAGSEIASRIIEVLHAGQRNALREREGLGDTGAKIIRIGNHVKAGRVYLAAKVREDLAVDDGESAANNGSGNWRISKSDVGAEVPERSRQIKRTRGVLAGDEENTSRRIEAAVDVVRDGERRFKLLTDTEVQGQIVLAFQSSCAKKERL